MFGVLAALFLVQFALPISAVTPSVELALAGTLMVLVRGPLNRGVRRLVYLTGFDIESIASLTAVLAFHASFVVTVLHALGRLGEGFYLTAVAEGARVPALHFTTAGAACASLCVLERVRRRASSESPISIGSWRGDRIWGLVVLTAAMIGLVTLSVLRGGIDATVLTVTFAVLLGAMPGILIAFQVERRRSLERWAAGAEIQSHHLPVLGDLSTVRVVCFNRLGTITYGRPRVTDVVPVDRETPPEGILNLASILEVRADHPFAAALQHRMCEDSPTVPQLRDVHYFPGRGVRAELYGQEVVLGSPRYLEELGVSCRSHIDETRTLCLSGKSVLALARDERLIGLVAFQDDPRPEASAVVHRLREVGLELRLFSGDASLSVEAVANSVGVDECHGELSRESGCAILRDLQAQHGHNGGVAVVGRGVFHATFLSVADCGVAFGPLGDATPETGGLELPGRNLHEVGALFEAAALVRRRQSLMARIGLTVQGILAVTVGFFGWQLGSASVGLTGGMVDVTAAIALAAAGVSAVLVRSCRSWVLPSVPASQEDAAGVVTEGVKRADVYGDVDVDGDVESDVDEAGGAELAGSRTDDDAADGSPSDSGFADNIEHSIARS